MRYISEDAISFSIRIEGRENSLRVNFSPVSSGGSTYSTSIPAAIKALESSKMFGKVYFRAPECVGVTEEQPKKTAKKRVTRKDKCFGFSVLQSQARRLPPVAQPKWLNFSAKTSAFVE